MSSTRSRSVALPKVDIHRRRDRIFALAPDAGVTARSDAGETVIDIVGEIGFDVCETDFAAKLPRSGDVTLRVNSPGGSAFDGVSIYNRLLSHIGRIRAEVTGIAASAASIIVMAADEIAIPRNAHLMIHRAWALTIGNGPDHTYMANLLGKLDGAMASIYAEKSGMSEAKALELMDAESWLNGEEAFDLGLSTEVPEAGTSKAAFDLSVYSNVPPGLKQAHRSALTLSSEVELQKILRGAGISGGAARKIAAGGFPALAGAGNSETFPITEALAAAAAQLRALKGAAR